MNFMSKKYIYDLTFQDILKEIFEEDSPCWYQGENFQDGVVFLKQFGDLRERVFTTEFGYQQDTPIISHNVYTQKYRRVTSQADAERKI